MAHRHRQTLEVKNRELKAETKTNPRMARNCNNVMQELKQEGRKLQDMLD